MSHLLSDHPELGEPVSADKGFEEWFEKNYPGMPMQFAGINVPLIRESMRAAWLASRTAALEECRLNANAAWLYGRTSVAHGYINSPPWSELHEDTKQLYLEKAAALVDNPPA